MAGNIDSPGSSSPGSPLKHNIPNNQPLSSSPSTTTTQVTTSNMSSSTLASSTTSTHHSLAATQNGVEKDLSSPFPPFAHQEVLATPFEAEIKRDEEFQAQLQQMLLDLILEVHAWSTSKPESESAAVGDALFQEAQNILQREQEQGMFSFFVESSRMRLLEFVTKIKTALAALTSFL